jgi:hypothetical protein
MDESWVVKANRERDRLADIKSRERLENFREIYADQIPRDPGDPGWTIYFDKPRLVLVSE